MDTKQLNQLDPKLKETYERIMGTKTTPSSPLKPVQPQAIQPPSPSPKTPSIFPASAFQVAQPQQPPTPKLFQPSLANQTQATTTIQSDVQTPKPQPILQPALLRKKSNKMTNLLIVIGGIIFILVYALVWIKILM